MKTEQQIRHALDELRAACAGATFTDDQVANVALAMACLAEWVLDLDDPNRKPNFARLMTMFAEQPRTN